MYVIEFCASDALEMIVAPVWRHGLRQEDYLEKQLDPVASRPLASNDAMALAVWLNAKHVQQKRQPYSSMLERPSFLLYYLAR